jgi:hypothetical protein
VAIRRRLVVVLTAAAALAALVLVVESHRTRSPRLGALRATPVAARISVRVGESVRFSAAADGATGFTWSVWGRRVSSAASWSYVPGPEDAGWQQISVEARGRRGRRVARAWDVGVVAAVAPEFQELVPPAGRIAVPLGERASFRSTARLPGGRPSDRLTFEWTMDGRLVLFERHPAEQAASELLLPPAEAGAHRLRVSVTEDGRTASLADWVIEVPSPAPEPVQEAAVPPPPPPAVEPRLAPAPGPRRLEAALGEAVALRAHVEPEQAGVSYRWTIDGRPGGRSPSGELEYRVSAPGRHRIAVTAEADGRVLGRDAWMVIARAPEPTPPAADDVVSPARVEPAPEPPPSLAEADVHRWLEEYARAWSRKDLGALRRMGQVRSAAEAARLERYFESIGELEVNVHVVALHVDGERASVEFERVDTVTDPSGRRQQLRLPPIRKQIERTPDGLRFTDRGGQG